MFQDFQLSITHLGDNRYFLRTEKVAAGVPLAEEQVEWDVDQWLLEAQNLMSDPLSRLLQGTGRLSAQNRLVTPDTDLLSLSVTEVPAIATTLVEFGQKLYRALFIGSLKESWSKAQAIAHNQNQILRLRLGFKEARLSSLPWEVMNRIDTEDGEIESLTTGIETSFSRYHSKTQGAAESLSMDEVQPQTLKILMVLASPTDQDRLELRQEAEHLQQELDNETAVGSPALELKILDNPGRQELTETLEQGRFQVFHYAGHSNLGHSGGDIYLVNRDTGLTEPFAGDDLAGLLVNNGVQFAIFNSCHGADGLAGLQSQDMTERNLAQALVRRGIAAVVAMSAQIPDQVALTFTRLLYRNLHLGYPIDFSLSRVRQGLISAYGSHQLYWALPVLSMNPHFHGLLQHRPLNREGLAELLHIADLALSGLSLEDESRLAIADPYLRDDDFLDDDGLDEALFSPPSRPMDGAETDFIKNILAEISSDIQEIKEEKQGADPLPRRQGKGNKMAQWCGRYRWQLAIATGLVIALGGGLSWFQGQQSKVNQPPGIDHTVAMQPDLDLSTLSNEMLLALAQKEKNNWSSLAAIATELLNQQAMPQANAVIYEIAVADNADPAELNFLKGRYAWQMALQNPQGDYSFNDVRRFWLTAYEQAPEQLAYLNAVGFAYYAENKYEEASKVWSEVTEVITVDPAIGSQSYAGLALAFYQQAKQKQGGEQKSFASKVEKLQKMAIALDPQRMSADALAQNWLWSEQAIADWQELTTTQAN